MKKKIFNKVKVSLFWLVVFLFYYKILANICKDVFHDAFASPNLIIKNMSLSLFEILTISLLLLVYNKTIFSDFKKFKKDYKKNLDTGFKYYCIGLIIMLASNLIMALLTDGLATNEELNRKYLQMLPVYSVIAMVIIGPAVEEIVFRLGLRKVFNKEIVFCLASALIFGGLHVYTAFEGLTFTEALKNWIQLFYIVPYSALGFGLAKAYYKTNNIWTTISIHTFHNALTLLLVFSVR